MTNPIGTIQDRFHSARNKQHPIWLIKTEPQCKSWSFQYQYTEHWRHSGKVIWKEMLLDLSLKWTDVCHEFANWVGGLVLQQQQKLLYFAIFRVKNEISKYTLIFWEVAQDLWFCCYVKSVAIWRDRAANSRHRKQKQLLVHCVKYGSYDKL